MSESKETVYERIERLEEEVGMLRAELDILKRAVRTKIARHEISMIKKGQDIKSILD